VRGRKHDDEDDRLRKQLARLFVTANEHCDPNSDGYRDFIKRLGGERRRLSGVGGSQPAAWHRLRCFAGDAAGRHTAAHVGGSLHVDRASDDDQKDIPPAMSNITENRVAGGLCEAL
jgi:hypothetical protein